MKTTLEMPKKQLQLESITEEQIRQMGRDYNPAEWDRIVSRYAGYKDVQFYFVKPDEYTPYDRFYAVYTTDGGVRLLKSVCYSSSLTSNGFSWAMIPEMTIGGLDKDGLYIKLFHDNEGNKGRLEKNKSNWDYMASQSQRWGDIFTDEF